MSVFGSRCLNQLRDHLPKSFDFKLVFKKSLDKLMSKVVLLGLSDLTLSTLGTLGKGCVPKMSGYLHRCHEVRSLG